MSKPMVIGASAGSNAVVAKDFVETDGSGCVKAFDGTGDILGITIANKDVNNMVGVIKQGIVFVPTVSYGTYQFGDKVEWAAGQTVQSLSTGVLVGTIAKTKQATSTDNLLAVYVNFA